MNLFKSECARLGAVLCCVMLGGGIIGLIASGWYPRWEFWLSIPAALVWGMVIASWTNTWVFAQETDL